MMTAAVFRKNKDVVRRVVAGEVILVPIRTRVADMTAIYALDEVADFIWNELDTGRTAEEIAARVQNEFDTEGHDVLADVTALLADLESAGLVECAGEQGS